MMFRFERLEVWQEAVGFADRVYDITATFPDTERFGLTSQMRRAGVSVSSNIAEGSGRASDTEFARFVGVTYGSLMEIVSQSHLASRRRYITAEDHDALRRHAERLARMLSGLRARLRGRKPSVPDSVSDDKPPLPS